MVGTGMVKAEGRVRRLGWALLVVVLAGCWLTDAELEAKLGPSADGDSGSPEVAITIEGLAPSEGSVAGGTEVEIQARPLRADTQVWFGEMPAEILSQEGDRIRVVAPSGPAEGWSSVVVRSGDGEGRLDDAFWYWRDGEGLAGIVGEYSWQITVGEYWEGGAPPPSGQAVLGFLRPTAFEFTDFWASELNRCERGYSWDGELALYDTGASELVLRGRDGSVVLPRDGQYQWFEAPLSSEDYPYGVTFALDAMDAPEPWSGLGLDELFRTPGLFSLSRPSIASSSVPWVQQNVVLEWTGTPADALLVELRRYEGSSVVDEVRCALEDDGYHVVPESVWSGWSAYDQMTIRVGRARRLDAELPGSGASNQAVSILWLVGAAFQDF